MEVLGSAAKRAVIISIECGSGDGSWLWKELPKSARQVQFPASQCSHLSMIDLAGNDLR
jgi:hypothetical protein